MSKSQLCRPVIAIVGGDGRDCAIRVDADIRSYPSRRNGGNGSIRDAIAAIKGGNIQLVLLLARWLGHSGYVAIARACKSARVPYMTIPKGSLGGYQQEVQAYLDAFGPPRE